ncbi:hypothetical protein [Kibdelosporangium philippinense]|uniref:hypothetical protein n=1 Tax=Kibdelosporangium philippinense TaxID=211113 RepID=UPI0036111EE4
MTSSLAATAMERGVAYALSRDRIGFQPRLHRPDPRRDPDFVSRWRTAMPWKECFRALTVIERE